MNDNSNDQQSQPLISSIQSEVHNDLAGEAEDRRFTPAKSKRDQDSQGEFKPSFDFLDDLKRDAELSPEEIEARNQARNLEIEGHPIAKSMIDLKHLWVGRWNDQFGNVKRQVVVPFDQAMNHEFIQLNFPNMHYSISIAVELHALHEIENWPSDSRSQMRLIRRELGLMPGTTKPLPNYMIISRSDREPPLVHLIYMLELPVSSGKFSKKQPVKRLREAEKLLCRGFGGTLIGPDNDKYRYSYNPAWNQFLPGRPEADRLEITKPDCWLIKNGLRQENARPDLIEKAGAMTPRTRLGRDESIVEEIRAGRPKPQIGKRNKMTRQNVYKIGWKHGVKARKPITHYERQIKQMYFEDNKTQQQIADRFECDKAHISRIVNRP